MQDRTARPVAALLAGLEGRWEIEREIDDRMAGEHGRFVGGAVFVPSSQGMDYLELGHLSLPGRAPLRAERRYLWRDGGDRVEVQFGDGRDFHWFDPLEGRAVHRCAPDVYRVAYSFGSEDAWEAVWDVSGPRKDYVMRTHYRRA